MGTKSINALTVTTSAAAGDLVPIWRASNSDTRKITKANFMGGVLTGAGTIATGGFTLTLTSSGTLALGGFTLTVPATGTAALLGTANTFTQTNAFAAASFSGTATHNGQLTVSQFLVLTSATATLATDAFTATATLMIVDTEGGAGTDTLSRLMEAWIALIIVRQSNSSHDILIDTSTGNIRNHGLGNRQMSDNSFMWMGIYKSSVSLWLEVAWAN